MATFSEMTNCNTMDELLLKSTEFASRKLKISAFKDLQLKAILSVLRGQDAFVSLPTGYGKSAIYQAIPLCRDFLRMHEGHVAGLSTTTDSTSPTPTVTGSGTAACSIVVVISPLVSLMKSQVATLKKLGLTAVHLGESSPEDEKLIKEGKVSYVFMSPESVFDRGFELFQSSSWHDNLSAIAVDESHCVVKWGRNSKKLSAFRGSYGRLAEIRSLIPRAVPVMSLTATSTLALRSELIISLSLTTPSIITDSPDRPNIFYNVIHTSQKENPQIFHSLVLELKEKKEQTPRSIIFCRTHRQCRSLYSYFRDELGSDYKQYFAMFHSTTDDNTKEYVLKSFSDTSGQIKVLFCTIAFGMGIDCQNLTRIYHYGPSEDVDDYVQESGRGGRGGESCTAILVAYRGCTRQVTSQRMKDYMKNTSKCRRGLLLTPFGVKPSTKVLAHTCCDVCAEKCKCGGEMCSEPEYGRLVITDLEAAEDDDERCRLLTQAEKATLKEQLLAVREETLKVQPSALYSGHDLTGALPLPVIDMLVRDSEIIRSGSMLESKCSIFGDLSKVWDILSSSGTTCSVSTSHGLRAERPATWSDSTDLSDSDTNEHRGVLIPSDSD